MGNHEKETMGIREFVDYVSKGGRLWKTETVLLYIAITAFLFLGIGYAWRYAQDQDIITETYELGIHNGDIPFVKELFSDKRSRFSIRHFIWIDNKRQGYEIEVRKKNGVVELRLKDRA